MTVCRNETTPNEPRARVSFLVGGTCRDESGRGSAPSCPGRTSQRRSPRPSYSRTCFTGHARVGEGSCCAGRRSGCEMGEVRASKRGVRVRSGAQVLSGPYASLRAGPAVPLAGCERVADAEVREATRSLPWPRPPHSLSLECALEAWIPLQGVHTDSRTPALPASLLARLALTVSPCRSAYGSWLRRDG